MGHETNVNVPGRAKTDTSPRLGDDEDSVKSANYKRKQGHFGNSLLETKMNVCIFIKVGQGDDDDEFDSDDIWYTFGLYIFMGAVSGRIEGYGIGRDNKGRHMCLRLRVHSSCYETEVVIHCPHEDEKEAEKAEKETNRRRQVHRIQHCQVRRRRSSPHPLQSHLHHSLYIRLQPPSPLLVPYSVY